jgi:hypothetical protein
MKSVEQVLAMEQKNVISKLRELTKSSTAKELDAALPVWLELSATDDAFLKVVNSPNREKAIIEACKSLRIIYPATGIKLLASLNRFRALHSQLQYVQAMKEAHEKNRALIVEH